MAYSKPWLGYAAQVALLKSRGVQCDDEARAEALLRAVGYYNFSGYLYPFRLTSLSGKGRLNQVRPGTSFDQVETLMAYDADLRAVMLEALQAVEVAVRAQIAHVLGRRDPFGHLDKRRLDPGAANRYRAGQGHTAFDRWLEEYERLQSRARKETFVAHNLAKYGPPLPIWIACEFLNFGAVSNLYQLLKYDDRQQIASDAGLRHERTLRGWLIALNYLRNVCAHNQRIWNRVLVVKPSLKGKDLPGDLSHLAGASNGRLYPASAITAHLLRTLSLASGWRDKMAETLDRFPDSTGWAVTDMGTPANWRALPIWSY